MFNIGDRVEVVPAAPYSWTRAGSIGTILGESSSSRSFYVDFEIITGDGWDIRAGTRFEIMAGHLKLLSPIDPEYSSLSPVCKKIRQIKKRRESLGYKY